MDGIVVKEREKKKSEQILYIFWTTKFMLAGSWLFYKNFKTKLNEQINWSIFEVSVKLPISKFSVT
jgi:hypothetical protein